MAGKVSDPSNRTAPLLTWQNVSGPLSRRLQRLSHGLCFTYKHTKKNCYVANSINIVWRMGGYMLAMEFFQQLKGVDNHIAWQSEIAFWRVWRPCFCSILRSSLCYSNLKYLDFFVQYIQETPWRCCSQFNDPVPLLGIRVCVCN